MATKSASDRDDPPDGAVAATNGANGKDDAALLAAFEARYGRRIARRRRSGLIGLVVLCLLFAASVVVSDFYPGRLIDGWQELTGYLGRLVPPLSPDLLWEDDQTAGSFAYWLYNLGDFLLLLLDTVNMAIVATLAGAAFAVAASFVAARNLMSNTPLFFLARRLLEIARAVPELVYAMMFVWSFGVGPVAGILAIAIHTAGALGKLFAEVNENVDPRPVEGLRAAGANWFMLMRFAVTPQVLPNFVSYAILRFEINIRAASIIGLVGAGGIGFELITRLKKQQYIDAGLLVLIIVLAVVVLDLISERVRRRVIGRGVAA
ncbi:MAG: phosphonate ABC transporter, permease protein PhnE [Alphaproteobacteria bacterium]